MDSRVQLILNDETKQFSCPVLEFLSGIDELEKGRPHNLQVLR